MRTGLFCGDGGITITLRMRMWLFCDGGGIIVIFRMRIWGFWCGGVVKLTCVIVLWWWRRCYRDIENVFWWRCYYDIQMCFGGGVTMMFRCVLVKVLLWHSEWGHVLWDWSCYFNMGLCCDVEGVTVIFTQYEDTFLWWWKYYCDIQIVLWKWRCYWDRIEQDATWSLRLIARRRTHCRHRRLELGKVYLRMDDSGTSMSYITKVSLAFARSISDLDRSK